MFKTMSNKLKYILITAGVLTATIATYFAIRYYKIKKAYSTVLSENQAIQLIKDKANSFDERDIDYDEADREFGVIGDRNETGVILGSEENFNDFMELCEQDPELCEEMMGD